MNYEIAKKEITAGKLQPHALWILISDESERDGYALKPAAWEGPGEYQRVAAGDDLGFLVKLPAGANLKAAT